MNDDTTQTERTAEAKLRVIEALRELPIITAVCKRETVSKATYYRWRKEDPAFLRESNEAYCEGVEHVSDMSEVQIISLIKDKKLPAATFWLKHRSPAYGGNAPPTEHEEEAALSDDQKRAIRETLAAFAPRKSARRV